jgi:hypothetical protein
MGHGKSGKGWRNTGGGATSSSYASTTPGVPTWDGAAEGFAAFKVECEWYLRSLKWNERYLAASRVWQNLRGIARLATRRLQPGTYDKPEGLLQLLKFLETTPLTKAALPDAYSKIDSYRGVRRGNSESCSTYIMREQEAFTKMLEALARLRKAQRLPSVTATPKRAPRRRRGVDSNRGSRDEGSDTTYERVSEPTEEGTTENSDSEDSGIRQVETSFFGDEIRGYQLLRYARLSTTERSTILAHTKNRTSFAAVREALLAWGANEEELKSQDRGKGKGGRHKGYLTTQAEVDDNWESVMWGSTEAAWGEDTSWGADSWEALMWQGEELEDWWAEAYYGSDADEELEAGDETLDESGQTHEVEEAEVLVAQAEQNVAESRRTLAQARQAVKDTEGARQYFSPGKAWSPKGKGKGKSGSKGKGKGKGKDDGCAICHSPEHWWKACPMRSSKGKGKGKGKGKSKKGYWLEEDDGWYDTGWDESAAGYFVANNITIYQLQSMQPTDTMCVLDTGATQSAGGKKAIEKMIHELRSVNPAVESSFDVSQRPWFHFGNGGWLQATGRHWIATPLGDLAVYELQAENVPVLIGADVLESWGILISYKRNEAILESEPGEPRIELLRSSSGHRLIDLSSAPLQARLRAG